MGKFSRNKGGRVERVIVNALQAYGFAAERIPLSGAAGGRFCSDVSVPVLGVDRRIEVKCRANGFATLYGWLEGSDMLVIKADRKEPLLVLPLKLAAHVASVAEKAKP